MTFMTPTLAPEAIARALIFSVALLALFVAHQVGDHVLQTDRQAATKTDRGQRGLRGMLGHLAVYHLTAAGLLITTASVLGLPLSATGLVAGLAFSALTHALLDRRWPVRVILRATHAPRFADTTSPVCGMYVADQALHQLALLVSALLIAAM
jgi:phosphate/sulfate permease